MARTEIRGFDAVRAAARDIENFSSDLLGDRDVRDYRQLPLEADPPRHTLFRQAVQPLFHSDVISKHSDAYRALARKLIDQVTSSTEPVDVPSQIALPYVIGCLCINYNRPDDYDEWLAWGPDVWTADAYRSGSMSEESELAHRERDFAAESDRDGRTLQAYLDRVFDEAERKMAAGEPSEDAWDFVARLEVDGVAINRKEMQGIANVLLAGGRDTVIKLITGLVWHLIESPVDREFLIENPTKYQSAMDELVRYLSPLPKMERIKPEYLGLGDLDRPEEAYVLLSWASANHDPAAWQSPEKIDIHRGRQPHLGFGHGKHSCMGMNVTEYETKAFLAELLGAWPNWRFATAPDIAWVTETGADGSGFTLLDRFRGLLVEVAPEN